MAIRRRMKKSRRRLGDEGIGAIATFVFIRKNSRPAPSPPKIQKSEYRLLLHEALTNVVERGVSGIFSFVVFAGLLANLGKKRIKSGVFAD